MLDISRDQISVEKEDQSIIDFFLGSDDDDIAIAFWSEKGAVIILTNEVGTLDKMDWS